MSRRLRAPTTCLIFVLAAVAGCQIGTRAEADMPTVAAEAMIGPEASPADTTTAPSPSSTPTMIRTRLPTYTPTPTALPTPSPTPVEPLILAAPAFWELEARQAIARVEAMQEWRLVTASDPRQLLDVGRAHAALAPGNGGYFAGQRPLALAVPFSSDWDDVSLEQAQAIAANGHALVSVLPWDELAPAQRALTVDGLHIADPAYPLQREWSVVANAQASTAAAQLAGQLQALARVGDVRLAAVGDIMLDRALGAALAAGDTGFPFAFVAGPLHSADLTVGNVESALGDVGEPAAKSYTFQAPPAAARSLAEAGFDVVSLANNHALDFGPQALLQGIGLLEAEGVAIVGAGADNVEAHRPHVAEVNGIRLGFLAYVNVPVEGNAPYFDTASWAAGTDAPGLAWAEPDVVSAEVSALREVVDQVIVILHSGYEYVPSPSPEQAASARAAVDAGAALVIGHHAHILQGVEFRAGGAIAYGLANFAFNITGPPETVILNAWFDENGLRQLQFTAATIQGSGQPAPAGEAEAAAIRRQIFALSRSLN